MPVYLAHNTTSPMHVEVIDAMLPYVDNPVSNPSSLHSYGRKPRQALISRGRQEHRRRAGTENAAGIVGLGKAAELARLEIDQRKHHLEQLRIDGLPAVLRQAAV